MLLLFVGSFWRRVSSVRRERRRRRRGGRGRKKTLLSLSIEGRKPSTLFFRSPFSRSHLPGLPARPGRGRGGSGPSRESEEPSRERREGERECEKRERGRESDSPLGNGDGKWRGGEELEKKSMLSTHSSSLSLLSLAIEKDFYFPRGISSRSLRPKAPKRVAHNAAAAARRFPERSDDAPLAFSDEPSSAAAVAGIKNGDGQHCLRGGIGVVSSPRPLLLFQ